MNLTSQIRDIITYLGDNPDRPGLSNTPHYVADFYKDFFDGYSKKVEDFNVTFPYEPTTAATQKVTMKKIRFFSMCEHHLLPFRGTVTISYIPNKKLIGFSEFVSIVNMYAHRLQVQERLIAEILDAVVLILDPLECSVTVNASHLCMKMRGERDQSSRAISQLSYQKKQ